MSPAAAAQPPTGVPAIAATRLTSKSPRAHLAARRDDVVLSVDHAKANHAAVGATRKRLVLIEGKGHNDLVMADEYFASIARFVDELFAAPEIS